VGGTLKGGNVAASVARGVKRPAFDWHLVVRRLPVGVALGATTFAVIWVLFWAPKTNFGPAIHSPSAFLLTLLDSVTLAGLLFIVASGFSLIFGLMRVVNMAHGSFLLLGGYIAYEMQQWMTNGGGVTVFSSQVSAWEWIVPAIVAAAAIACLGLVVQQLFLRWTMGQDLRQALITIAISVIVADQIVAHFPLESTVEKGSAVNTSWPGSLDRLVNLHVAGVQYSLAKLSMLALGVGVGIALWLWLYRTRTGMVIRAGVDDRQMTSALGVNVQVTFAIAFAVGAALAALGGAVFASYAGVNPTTDGQWLLYSLVVVIVGGLGSIFGTVAGALLFGFVYNFSVAYLPTTGNNCCGQYAIVFTFALLALVLAFRPHGIFGKPA
jgi:branched-chain amino acid transport system permease protein